MLARNIVTCPQRKSPMRGFTLIEILVVVVIVGIISAVALLSFGILGDDRDLQREARRLASLIELANDEATLQGRDYGLEFIRSGYRFVEHDPFTEQWIEVVGDEILRPRDLGEAAEFSLYLEDREILLKTEAEEIDVRDSDEDDETDEGTQVQNQVQARNPTDDYVPHILIMSSGDVTPFELTLERIQDLRSVTITMSAQGELEIGTDDQPTL